MNITEIKDDYLTGAITFEEAKERLFEYSPHPVAAENNNEVLKSWLLIKKSRAIENQDFSPKVSTEVLVPIETNRICAETFNKPRVYYKNHKNSFIICTSYTDFINIKISRHDWFILMQVNEVKDFLNL